MAEHISRLLQAGQQDRWRVWGDEDTGLTKKMSAFVKTPSGGTPFRRCGDICFLYIAFSMEVLVTLKFCMEVSVLVENIRMFKKGTCSLLDPYIGE